MKTANKRILLIDNREDRLSRAELILKEAGYTVCKARDLEEAQAIFRKEGNSFDLIIADQLQAEREKDALKRLIWAEPDRRRRVVVSFVTEPTLPKMREVFKLGVYDCVTKPDEPERLVEVVQEVLGNE
jgi:DNA-binding NtrC family response regulator